MSYCNRLNLIRAVAAVAVSAFSLSAGAQEPTSSDSAAPSEAGTRPSAPTSDSRDAPDSKLGATENTDALDRKVTTKSWPNVPLMVTGLVVLGGSYGASALVGGLSGREADRKLYYPVVGPWMDLNNRGCDTNPCNHKAFNTALLIGDGVLQGMGALGLVLSLVVPQTSTKNWLLIGNETVVLAPQVGLSSVGVSAAARF